MAGHYFNENPAVASKPGTVAVEVAGLSFELATDAGVFSRERLDPGTRVLLAEMPFYSGAGQVLDVGCGYGPIACALGLRNQRAPISGVDVNERALELLRRNATTLGLGNVGGYLPEAVPEVRFAAIYSNPPIRIGKPALHELLLRWLGRLAPDGHAYLVVQKNLGADSLASWLGDQGHPAERIASHRGYRVLDVRDSPPPG